MKKILIIILILAVVAVVVALIFIKRQSDTAENGTSIVDNLMGDSTNSADQQTIDAVTKGMDFSKSK